MTEPRPSVAAPPAWRRWLTWGLLLVGGALLLQRVLALSSGDEAEDVVAPATRASRAPTDLREGRAAAAIDPAQDTPPADTALRLDRLASRAASTPPPAAGLFAGPPPPPAPVRDNSPAPPPQAPPFPYRYLGGLADGAGRSAFFAQGDRVLSVRVGDEIDDTWRVEQLDEQRMRLTYLPLKKPLDVAFGAPR